jgi:L-ascorbate metabolism protein UlaG (beta-lactamase superfamily)
MESLSIDGCTIEWLGHASFRIIADGTTIYIDPFVLDDGAPEADLIIATHDHFDHCHVENIDRIKGAGTTIVTTGKASDQVTGDVRTLAPGDEIDLGRIRVRAVHAYNVNKFREPGQPFHPKGDGMGVIISIDGSTIYHSGDTDVIEEMKALGDLGMDVALLPAGGTYTMDSAEAAEAVKLIKPRIVVPMHFGTLQETRADLELFGNLVGDTAQVVVLDQKE